ncbi:hypothetical protein AU210_016329 [Fusarium oxysporum f. sp. radicis-cucumerinum]|uniref:Uncharacterized protein n=1 Tax=Fusarium oxysporum f. sp. radicis-cucumerinum TaxID=327505 RepID=A0A2H3G2J3_FUSOX|nr:hypothetical protein AU210_016329 [Fusarium oxysporum f. sp. radicis-cucumerinum]
MTCSASAYPHMGSAKDPGEGMGQAMTVRTSTPGHRALIIYTHVRLVWPRLRSSSRVALMWQAWRKR